MPCLYYTGPSWAGLEQCPKFNQFLILERSLRGSFELYRNFYLNKKNEINQSTIFFYIKGKQKIRLLIVKRFFLVVRRSSLVVRRSSFYAEISLSNFIMEMASSSFFFLRMSILYSFTTSSWPIKNHIVI